LQKDVPDEKVVADVADVAALKTAPIVAVTPDERDVPLAAAIPTAPDQPVERVAAAATTANSSHRR
jgi:hypothetical protein